ncbi:hypothetical protein ASG00_07180 [Microbacterium sp. Leaf351]|nr:hypothetical protein ASG00_07180 [Microbacterium sp. Leaf351]
MIRTPDDSCSASDFAHTYGVAGSLVVPMTMIGGAPGALIFSRTPVAVIGQTAHGSGPLQYGAIVGAFAAISALEASFRACEVT